MKILKILGIAAGIHALALLLIFANPGCTNTKAASADPAPISSAPAQDSSAAAAGPVVSVPSSEPATIRYSPTRPGTAVASALASQPVPDVIPATTYTVSRGDTLSSIAKKNGLSKADLAAANNLRSSSVLRTGQKIIIPSRAPKATASMAPAAAETVAAEAPASGAEKAPAGDATKHVVKSGETLGSIARRYGVKQGDLAVANNITDPRKIQPGQELVIPAKASTSTKQARASKPEGAAGTVPTAPAADQDLDAGLKPTTSSDVPVIKIEPASGAQQPKSP